MTIEVQRINNTDMRLAEILTRHQNGDDGAFTELYELQNEKVYRQLLRLGLSTEDALDGVQQIFEKIFVAIDQFEPGNLGGWISVITHNYAMDCYRKAGRRKTRIIDTPLDKVKEPIHDDDGLTELDTGWLIDDIIEQVRLYDGEGFDAKDLGVILREEAAGKSREEIAEQLGVKPVTINTRLARLRKRLANNAFTRESLQ